MERMSIEFIRGSLVSIHHGKKGVGHVVLDWNGIGLRCFMSSPQMTQCTRNEEICLFISSVMKDSEWTLYGFLKVEERDFFEKLTHVSGIGPKTALSLLGAFPSHKLASLIAQEDVSSITSVPGIGKKSAQRLVVELKGVLPTLEIESTDSLDAVQALIRLGYKETHAQRMVHEVLEKQPQIALGELIRKALLLSMSQGNPSPSIPSTKSHAPPNRG